MGNDHWNPSINHMVSAVLASRGISMMLIVLLMLMVTISAIGVLTFGVQLRAVKKDRITLERMETVRKALQRYYLSYHDLPRPTTTSPANTIPVRALNLSQEFRFDAAGQFIHYDCIHDPVTGLVDFRNLIVAAEPAAAVLVAPGPDKRIAQKNSPYADPAEGTIDDVVVAVSLSAEAVKIATRAVALLQAAAKAYDGQFNTINNDGDTSYLGCTQVDDPLDPRFGQWITRRPQPIIDEGNDPPDDDYPGYVPAEGVNGSGCVRIGRLSNDPDRGTASLDGCLTAANDIVAVFGLSKRYITDPWGNPYLWGSVRWVESVVEEGVERFIVRDEYGGLDLEAPERRDRRYWSFFSMGPDEERDTADDITPTADRIAEYD